MIKAGISRNHITLKSDNLKRCEMTWGWDSRGPLPIDANVTGTTGGGAVGSVNEAATAHAWPRYEAEYLKRALTSERYKYDTEGLGDSEKAVYLDRVTTGYKAEADECLKAEFEQWLEGKHEANDPDGEQEYMNAEGRPIRRWVYRTKEAEDTEGNSKVGQARAGWKHTPWARASLTGLPGVREYFRRQKDDAVDDDVKMQLLAEHGPHDLESSWQYFKHWVKGRPLSDAVALPAHFEHPGEGTRSDFGRSMPQRMYAYDADQPDHQPGVLASDRNAYNAAAVKPGEAPVNVATETDDRNLLDMKQLKEVLAGEVRSWDERRAEWDTLEKEDRAEARDTVFEQQEELADHEEEKMQRDRQDAATAPATKLLPAFS